MPLPEKKRFLKLLPACVQILPRLLSSIPNSVPMSKGEVSFSFTMPESLTRWNFRGYAHTKGMLMGTLDGEAITSKRIYADPESATFRACGR